MKPLTPMLQQYMSIKSEYPDAILFYRMGDFYEMFFDDAKLASGILGITLTSRGTYEGEKIPMCGVPHHASRAYIAKLVENGTKVAVCDQVEDPKGAKGIVKREVVRVVTAGSVLDEEAVDGRKSLFIVSVFDSNDGVGLAYGDLSTGEFRVTELVGRSEMMDELGRIEPAEVLVSRSMEEEAAAELNRYRLEGIDDAWFEVSRAENILKEQLQVESLEGFGLVEMPLGTRAAGALIHYLTETQKASPAHIRDVATYRTGDFMFLDEATCSHLELFKTMRRGSFKGSLLHVLDRTNTAMGARLLKQWLTFPLLSLDSIRKRLGGVGCLKDDLLGRSDLRAELDGMNDMERLNGRIALGRANARDLSALKVSLRKVPVIKAMLIQSQSILLSEIAEQMDPLEDVVQQIEDAIAEDPPMSIKDGGIIREGYNADLDALISLSRDGKGWISRFAATEQKRSGIASLKVGFNRVFGYYIEVSKANLHMVPEDYIRKQTLANGERYITEDLKEMEERVLGAEEKRVALESKLFEQIRSAIAIHSERIKRTASLTAEVDVLAGLAETAEQCDYVCPDVNEGSDIDIVDGRHPVIERSLKDETFVPNDIHLDSERQQVMIITGPNMAGKSTILRQTALTVLMAQAGSFVPASKAVIGLVDRIFSRVGAGDDLAGGLSTFMVEMNETANIMRHVSPDSLVILDEIGRGTSTYDGLSIAWAVAEALHDHGGKGVRTLFATHYHELTDLAADKPRVKNYNIAVREWKDRIIFLRKLVPGGTSRSYGIQVARIAGLPEHILSRAKEILVNLERSASNAHSKIIKPRKQAQLNLFDQGDTKLKDWISGLEIEGMTPLDALLELSKLREYVKTNGK
jgi:DNA mismatch repair protein MutS